MSASRRSDPEPALSDSLFSATCVAEPRFAPPLRASLRRWVLAQGLEGERLFALLVAVGEAVANAIEHAYRAPESASGSGLVSLHARREELRLVIDVEDAGSWKAPVARDERGRGLIIMRALTSDVEVQCDPTRTRVRLTFSLDGDDASSGAERAHGNVSGRTPSRHVDYRRDARRGSGH